MKTWKPTESDLAWTQCHLAPLKEGGIWGTSWGVYRVNGSEKKITLISRNDYFWMLNGPSNHGRVETVVAQLGWTMQDETRKGE